MSHVPAAEGPRVLPGPQIREAFHVFARADDLGFAWTRAAAQMQGETDQSGGKKTTAEPSGARQRRGRIKGKADKVLSDAATG